MIASCIFQCSKTFYCTAKWAILYLGLVSPSRVCVYISWSLICVYYINCLNNMMVAMRKRIILKRYKHIKNDMLEKLLFKTTQCFAPWTNIQSEAHHIILVSLIIGFRHLHRLNTNFNNFFVLNSFENQTNLFWMVHCCNFSHGTLLLGRKPHNTVI